MDELQARRQKKVEEELDPRLQRQLDLLKAFKSRDEVLLGEKISESEEETVTLTSVDACEVVVTEDDDEYEVEEEE